MFEDRTDLLREHIDYLKEYISEYSDNKEGVDIDELQSFLETCQEDIDNLKSDLPYDEIDDDDISIEDFSGDNLDDSELEDEIVEAEKVIEDLVLLMESAKEIFLEDEESAAGISNLTVKSSDLSEEEFLQKIKNWLTPALKEYFSKKGISKNDEEIIEFRDRMIERASSKKNDSCPDYPFWLFHITQEMIYEYSLIGRLMNFENSLSWFSFHWGEDSLWGVPLGAKKSPGRH